MAKTGEMVRAQGMIYKAVVLSVMLCGRDIWVVTRSMLKVLEGCHHRISRRIIGVI